jgi:alpha-ketoglutarate-dependent taurine dioxygenase
MAAFKDEMAHLLYDSNHCYEHEWQQGDVLMCDNHSLVHGRHAFRKNTPRHLRRIQLL